MLYEQGLSSMRGFVTLGHLGRNNMVMNVMITILGIMEMVMGIPDDLDSRRAGLTHVTMPSREAQFFVCVDYMIVVLSIRLIGLTI